MIMGQLFILNLFVLLFLSQGAVEVDFVCRLRMDLAFVATSVKVPWQ